MIHIAVFASGTGTNALALIQHFSNNKIAKVEMIITNNPHAGVVKIAEENNVALKVIHPDELSAPKNLIALMDIHQISFVVLAGFLKKIPVELIRHFHGRMINIHPSLLPKFGGKGMYGHKVHEAVLAAGEKESGITIHEVTENYDEGKILFQAKCVIDKAETVDSLAQKIHQLEHSCFPKVTEEQIQIVHT